MSEQDDQDHGPETTKRRSRSGPDLPDLLRLLLKGNDDKRTPFSTIMVVLAENVTTALAMNAILNEELSAGIGLLQLAGLFLEKVKVDKNKAVRLFIGALHGEMIGKDSDLTKLAADLLHGHVALCQCGEHLEVVLDEFPKPDEKTEESPLAG